MARVLVVEDETTIREVLVDAIRDAGYAIVEAATADEAFALLHTEGLRLVITDLNLPGQMNGIDLAAEAQRLLPGIAILCISGRPSMLEEAQRLINPGAFLRKPFGLTALINNVDRLVGVSSAADARR